MNKIQLQVWYDSRENELLLGSYMKINGRWHLVFPSKVGPGRTYSYSWTKGFGHPYIPYTYIGSL